MPKHYVTHLAEGFKDVLYILLPKAKCLGIKTLIHYIKTGSIGSLDAITYCFALAKHKQDSLSQGLTSIRAKRPKKCLIVMQRHFVMHNP